MLPKLQWGAEHVYVQLSTCDSDLAARSAQQEGHEASQPKHHERGKGLFPVSCSTDERHRGTPCWSQGTKISQVSAFSPPVSLATCNEFVFKYKKNRS